MGQIVYFECQFDIVIIYLKCNYSLGCESFSNNIQELGSKNGDDGCVIMSGIWVLPGYCERCRDVEEFVRE